MDFWRTVMVLFRRWYITVPAFFLTLGAAPAAAYSVVPVQYQSGSCPGADDAAVRRDGDDERRRTRTRSPTRC